MTFQGFAKKRWRARKVDIAAPGIAVPSDRSAVEIILEVIETGKRASLQMTRAEWLDLVKRLQQIGVGL